MENFELKKNLKNLRWRMDFLKEAYPEAIAKSLWNTSLSTGLGHELSVKAVFSGNKETIIAFFDELASELPFGAGPVLGCIKKQLNWLSQQIADGAITDHKLLSQALLPVSENEAHLYEPLALHKLSQSLSGTESIAERLAINGPWKRFSLDDETLQRLEELKEKTPNFTEVIDCVIDAVTLAVRYNRPLRITPILMVGEPGIGKSFFTNQLSPTLGVPLTRIAVDNLQIGSDLAGQSHAYTKSSPGSVFRVLTEEDHISPLVILDELDKVPSNWGYGDPLGPLHNLLEPVSAKVFKDASFPIPIDASHVIWVATANSLASIPQTIKSRFEVYKVNPPNTDCFDAILKEICRELESEYAGLSINNNVTKVLSGKTPREQRQLLQRAAARAIRLGDDSVNDLHLREVLGRGEISARLRAEMKPTGYL